MRSSLLTRMGIAALAATLAGCTAFFPKQDTLIRHHGVEVYDESNMSRGFFSYNGNSLIIEGGKYEANKDESRKYIVPKILLEKIFDFISEKVDMPEGIDIFASPYYIKTNQRSNGFYTSMINSNRELVNDHIYFQPLNENPLFLEPDGLDESSYNSDLRNGIINLFSIALHESTHLKERRNRETNLGENIETKRKLKEILENDLGIFARENGEENFEYGTDINEVYPEMFKLAFLIKYKDELEKHLCEDYIFYKDDGSEVLGGFKFNDLDLDPILKLMLFTDFEHKDVIPKTIFSDNEYLMQEKLKEIQKKLPELEELLFN